MFFPGPAVVLDFSRGVRSKEQLLCRFYWPGGNTVLGRGLRSLIAYSSSLVGYLHKLECVKDMIAN